MRNLREKIKELIEQKKQEGQFSVLHSETSIQLIQQIISNYERTNGIKQFQEGDTLPKKGELIFVAAPTGAGKDSLVARLCYQNPEKHYIELNMDIFRQYFPYFIKDTDKLSDKTFAEMTNEFAYEIYITIQEILLQEYPGTNIIITGTLREPDWVEKTFEKFKSNEKTDYDVKLVCLAVPKKESAISVIHRYVGIVDAQQNRLEYFPGTARYTSMQYHDETFEKFPQSLEYFQKRFYEAPGRIIDSIEVHRRSKTSFDFEDDTKMFSTEEEDTRSALDVVMQLRLKPYTTKYEDALLIMRRIKNNAEYLKSQDTLREVIRDLALILDYPEIVKKLDELSSDRDEPEGK